jgi:hypothetical protein
MRYSTQARAGLGLAEVLIAIGVLALGLLGILSLWPLAAVNMANAIKDENTAQLNQSATANMREIWKEEIAPVPPPALVKNLYPNGVPIAYIAAPSYGRVRYDPLFNAMSNPNFSFNPDLNTFPGNGDIPPAYVSVNMPPIPRFWHGPSYPVFVDPLGWNNGNNVGPQKYWVAGGEFGLAGTVGGIPRRSLRRLEWVRTGLPGQELYQTPTDAFYFANFLIPNFRNVLINRTCFRLDDIGFGKDGTPYNATGDPLQTSGTLGAAAMATQIQRDGRYSCGFMLKRPANNLVAAADLTVVVYSARSIDSPSDETPFRAYFEQGNTEAIVYYSGATKPKIRKGNWILDATVTRQNGSQIFAEPHGYFYRIVNVTEEVMGELRLELQTPVHWEGSTKNTSMAGGGTYGVAVLMDGVVEVFERSTLTQYTMPVP